MNEIRDYFLLNARKVDPTIKAKDKPLVDDQFSQVDVDHAYHLHIGVNTTDQILNGALGDVFSCTMKLYVSGRKMDNERYDCGYDKALSIRNELVKSSNIGDNEFITNVVPVGIVPSSAGNNEKVFIYEINVNVMVVNGI